MAATPLLGLTLPVNGTLAGTWGDVINDQITSLLDSAVAGTTTLSTDTDVTLSTTVSAVNTAREAILLCTGARTAIRTIIAPAHSKTYVVVNSTTGGYAVKLVGAGPTTGVTIANGNKALVVWNGSDFVVVGDVITPERETAVSLAAGVIDLSTGNYFYKTISADTTFTLSNIPTTGTAQSIILELTNGGAYVITYWSGVTFVSGLPPTLTVTSASPPGRDVLAFYTRDGGTTWSGFVVGKNLK